MKCRGACASIELLRLQNYLILGLRKLWARLSDSAALRRSITPVDETAITSVSFLSGDFAHASQMPPRAEFIPPTGQNLG